jgi:glycine cleavage system aminomethyltransferase T
MSLYRTGRKLRVSALHPKLQAAGAVFGEVLGYERPLFFNLDEFEKSIEQKRIFFLYFDFCLQEKISMILVNKVHLVKHVGSI